MVPRNLRHHMISGDKTYFRNQGIYLSEKAEDVTHGAERCKTPLENSRNS